jgi:hypothetical protein
MANDTVYTVLKDNSVSTDKIVDKAVTNSKLADGSVSRSKLDNDLSDLLSLRSFKASEFRWADSENNLPAYANTVGWIVNNHLYLYTGDGDTHSYTDCGELRGAQGVQGEKGEKGDKGDKGDTGDRGIAGLHISDIDQPTVSSKDEGINIIRITRSDGKEFSFQLKNGSKGTQGIGINSIVQTSTSNVDGGKNTVTVNLTNGNSYNIYTYNGTGRNKGYYYDSLSALKSAVPSPSVSDWAIVGGDIYVCESAGTWRNTGYSWKGSGDMSLNSVLAALNTTSLPTYAAYLHWTGSSFNWQNPTTSSSSSGGTSGGNTGDTTGGVVSLTNYTWWGSTFDEGSNSLFDKPLSGVKGLTLTNGSQSVLIDIDDDGNLRFNGNAYATGGVTALGSGGSSEGGSTTLGTLLTDINNANPTPQGTGNNEILCYKGGAYSWQDLASAAGAGIQIKNNSSVITNSSGDALSCTSLNFIFADSLTTTPITRVSDSEVKIDLSNLGSASLGTLLTAINKSNPTPTTSGQVLTYNGSGYSWTTPSTSSSGSGTVDLTGYATQSWVQNQGYATQSWVTNKGYLTSHQSLSDYLTKSAASSTYALKSHTHSTSDISGLASYVQNTKVNSASSADSATKLATARTIWGQSFNGTSNISGDMSSVGAMSFSNSETKLKPGGSFSDPYADQSVGIKVGGSLAATYYYSTGKIQLGSSTTSYGTIEWDSTNKAIKITGNLLVTGGVTCLS